MKRSRLGGGVILLEGNSLLPTSQFLYLRGLGTRDAFHTKFHHLHFLLNRHIEGRLVQLGFSVAFDRVSHHCMLYKFRSIDVE